MYIVKWARVNLSEIKSSVTFSNKIKAINFLEKILKTQIYFYSISELEKNIEKAQ